jgi:hypothetical protein
MHKQQQFSLALGEVEPPEDLMRAAWQRSRLKLSFDEAMRVTHFRICLRHLAMLAARGRKK